MAHTDAFVAATRFGLGPMPGELDAIAQQGPKPWLIAQLDGPDPEVDKRLAALGSAAEALGVFAARKAADDAARKMLREELRDDFVDEHAAHLAATACTTRPYRERLVAFWANHLTVSTTKKEIVALAGAFEREVIRPGLDGTYADLLVASARHPAMLAYLDNGRSVGPSSMAGMRSGRGINENYARELLELHTLGVNGGYDQSDVESLAELLTGWTVDVGRASQGTGGFVYRPERHEPGPHKVLGKSYGEAEPAIRALAAHPSTATHLATKLVRQFVADDPPPKAVSAIARAWTVSGGSLPAVHRALVDLPEAWANPLAKVRTPWDLVVATTRLLAVEPAADGTRSGPDGTAMLRSLLLLGQLPYRAPSPQGWPDRADAWVGPGAVWARLEWAELVARRFASTGIAPNADALAQAAFGPVGSATTRTAIAAAPPTQALALLIASPEFQRR